MKKIHYLLTGALAAIVTTASLSAATITQVGDNSFGESWLTGDDWSNGNPASAGNDYVNSGFLLRTPDGASNVTFPGDSLTIQGSGTLVTKVNSGVSVSVANLTLNGNGTFSNGGTNATTVNTTFITNSTITVNGTGNVISIGGNQADRGLVFQSTATFGGTGELRLIAPEGGTTFAKTLNILSPSFGGTLLLGYSGALTPPSGVGTLDLTLANGFVGNALNIGSQATYNLNGTQTFSNLIINSDTINPGTYSFADLNNAGYGAFFVDNSGSLTVIPEPSTFALLGGALALLAVTRRRRRRA